MDECTPINMVMRFKIIKGVAGDKKEELKQVKQLSRTKHAVTSPGGSFDNRVWIDSIGVPQGFFICHMINYTGYNQK